MDDVLISFGDAVKAARDGKVAGYLVRFGSPRDTDLEGDFFTAATDFGRPLKAGDTFDLNLYYAHGMDSQMGRKSVGSGTVTVKDAGLWYEAQIDESDEYRKMVRQLAEEGRLGFSSGAAGHLVVRSASGVGKATRIECWPLGEASLTPRPAEARNLATIKSLTELVDAEEVEPTPVPSRPATITELERRLRDALSLSRKEATKMASTCWPLLSDSEDDSEANPSDGTKDAATEDQAKADAAKQHEADKARRDLLRVAMRQQAQQQAKAAA